MKVENSKQQELLSRRARLLPAQQALLEQRLKGHSEAASHTASATSIERAPREGELPLTLREEHVLLTLSASGNQRLVLGNNCIKCFRIKGEFNAVAFEQAVAELGRRQEILRTRFYLENGRPRRVIEPTVAVSPAIVDFSNIPEVQQLEKVMGVFAQEGNEAFDLAKDYLWKVFLLRLGTEDHLMLLIVDHFICEEWSMNLLSGEFWTLYSAFSTNQSPSLSELPIQFADFAHWERRTLQGARLESLMRYWREQLDGMGALPEIRLPFELPVPRISGYKQSKSSSMVLPADLTNAMEHTNGRQGITSQVLMMAGLVVLLYRYTGKTDIGFRFATTKRHHPGTERIAGWFADRLVLRIKVKPAETFSALLHEVRNTLIEAYEHQDLPYFMFPDLDGNLSKDLYHPSVSFNMSFSETASEKSSTRTEAPGQQKLNIVNVEIPDLGKPLMREPGISVVVSKTDKLSIAIKYEADRYEPSAIAEFSSNYRAILEIATAQPETRLLNFPLRHAMKLM